ncbi:DUF4261 domain-containing protein [Saccharibacillus kuerlensis]|uniref:DUF4261 domain-containing protein n=1 Tax=Saccharibacillus kuerlensis TaxID=459527 RepID=A0ABQ2KX23_9BACL|nr:DUF4261 domain-containing protein [Saccharibacillus kuerlensis]GGN95852.1 hypothetical protein GCM10010969_12150 [Saccharibacillus kuerlensis]
MSFFSKWFKKDKTDQTETSGETRGTGSHRADAPTGNRRIAQSEEEEIRKDWTRVPEQRPGTKRLVRHILLRSPELGLQQFAQSLREREAEVRGGIHEGRIIVHYREMTVTADFVPNPLPNREAEQNCKYNTMWPNSEAEIEGYAAHMRVTAINVEDGTEGHKFLTKVVAALIGNMPNALAVYSAPMIVSRSAYLASADMLKDGLLPINLWVFVGLYGGKQGGSSYTHGMQDFGGDELELLNTQRSAAETFELMFSVAAYSIERGIRFQGGENIAFKEGQSLTLNRSAGAALEGMTMKIEGF